MKRAKLTQVSPERLSDRGADLTDRLLDREGSAPEPQAAGPITTAQGTGSRRAAKSQADLVTPPAPTRTVADLPKYTPYRTVEPKPPMTPGPNPEAQSLVPLPAETADALKKALAETEKAVAALIAAADAAPARHDLAVRYRLDALAHHLRQVAEFIAGQ